MSLSRDRHAQRAPAVDAAPGASRDVRRAACGAVVAAACLLLVAAARAEPEPPRAAVRLEYTRGSGAERCPDEAFLRAEAARLLGYDPFRDDAPLVITARIERAGSELVATLSLRDAEGKTRWADGFGTSGGCEEIAAGMALTLVAGIQSAPGPATTPPHDLPSPPATPPPQPPSATPAPEHAPPPQPPRRAAPPPMSVTRPDRKEASAPAEERLQIEAGVGAVVGLGMAPGLAAGMTLTAGVRRGDGSIALEGRGLASLGQEVEGMTMRTTAFMTAGVACLHGRLLFGCGLVTVGAVRFVPGDPWSMRPRTDVLSGLGARLGGEWPLSERWYAHGYIEAIGLVDDVVLRRQSAGSEPPAPLRWASPPLGAALGLLVTATY
jgi:hypothetical protein